MLVIWFESELLTSELNRRVCPVYHRQTRCGYYTANKLMTSVSVLHQGKFQTFFTIPCVHHRCDSYNALSAIYSIRIQKYPDPVCTYD